MKLQTFENTEKEPSRRHNSRSHLIDVSVRALERLDSNYPVYTVTTRVRRCDGEIHCEQHRFKRKAKAQEFARRQIRGGE